MSRRRATTYSPKLPAARPERLKHDTVPKRALRNNVRKATHPETEMLTEKRTRPHARGETLAPCKHTKPQHMCELQCTA